MFIEQAAIAQWIVKVSLNVFRRGPNGKVPGKRNLDTEVPENQRKPLAKVLKEKYVGCFVDSTWDLVFGLVLYLPWVHERTSKPVFGWPPSG